MYDWLHYFCARRGGAEVAGWTLDWKIRVRFPAYPHRVWALWWQGGKRRLRASRCPCRGRLGTLKNPSCPWRGCPAAGQNLETGHLSRHYIAEISLNVTLNHNQQHQHYFCCEGEGWALVNQLNHISGIIPGTSTDRPKSVRNRCVIEVLVAFFILSRCFLDFLWV